MRRVNGLSVIESPYTDINWVLDSDDRSKILADVNVMEGPMDTQDYRLCGVYHKAGVPFDVNEVSYQEIPNTEIYAAMSKAISDACYEGLSKGKVLLLAGGRCTFNVGVAGGIQRALGPEKTVGIVWMDAHGDMSVPENSPTGLLAGMPLATILGLCLDNWRLSAGIEVPYRGDYVLASDCRDMGEGPRRNAAKANVKILDTAEFQDADKWSAAVQELAGKVDAIWLHVDMDILDEKHIPNFICPLPAGSEVETVMRNIKTVMATGKALAMSVSNVYFGRPDPGYEQKTFNAMRLMGAGLEAWRECPEF